MCSHWGNVQTKEKQSEGWYAPTLPGGLIQLCREHWPQLCKEPKSARNTGFWKDMLFQTARSFSSSLTLWEISHKEEITLLICSFIFWNLECKSYANDATTNLDGEFGQWGTFVFCHLVRESLNFSESLQVELLVSIPPPYWWCYHAGSLHTGIDLCRLIWYSTVNCHYDTYFRITS